MSAAVAAAPAPTAAGSGSDEPLVRARKLTKRYGELVAVDRLDLELRRGEIFGLLGQNGAGKTTTILMLLGLTEPTSGEARVVGLDPARNPLEVKRRVGYLPDAVGFYGDLTGRENLRYTARLNGLSRAEAEPQITEVLDQVGLADRADDRTDTYSRGMLQRLGIADALVKEPAILILDEPTTAIDPIGVIEILDLLRRLVRERGLAILLSSHLLGQVQSVCDRIGIFAAGRMIGQGSLAKLARTFGEESGELTVGVEADPSSEPGAVEARLASIDGVSGVTRVSTTRDNEWTWHVRIAVGASEPRVRAAILASLVGANLQLADLARQPPSLEDIYRRAVEQARLDREARARARGAAKQSSSRRDAATDETAEADEGSEKVPAGAGGSAGRPAHPAPSPSREARTAAGLPSRVRSRRSPRPADEQPGAASRDREERP
jgi:ABC-2 type transport system ATP-binding protein